MSLEQSVPATRILTIDDDPAILHLVDHVLTRRGHQVITRPDPAQAMQYLETHARRVSVIICDWNMPGMTGLQFVQKIKAIDSLRFIPVIMLTGRSQPQDIQAGINAGAFYYLTKPFEQGVLLSLIESAIISRLHIQNLQIELDDTLIVTHLVDEALFHFKTINEAERLAFWFSQCCPDPAGARLGLHELLINAVEHGNLEISYDDKTILKSENTLTEVIKVRLQSPPYKDRRGTLHFKKEKDQLVFHIMDQGPGFDFAEYLTLSPDRAFANHGRGIAMANHLSFQSLEYIDPGNQVIARIKIDS